MYATAAQPADPDPDPQVPEPEKRVPEGAFLWGFVRRTANDKDDAAALRETDIGLWLDEKRYRFVVASGREVKDDLAPMEFIQFIRELKHSRTQTLFKLGNCFDRSPRRATPVWTRPIATVIHFPERLRLLARSAAQGRTDTRDRRQPDSTAVGTAAAHGDGAREARRRIGKASARFG
jgi:hypothetical protein